MRSLCLSVCLSLASVLGGSLAFAQTAPDGEAANRGPHTGFLLQGRLGAYVGGSSGSAVVLYTPASPGAAFGYRGRSWSLAFSPSYTSTGLSTTYSFRDTSIDALGLSLLVEFSFARALSGAAELRGPRGRRVRALHLG